MKCLRHLPALGCANLAEQATSSGREARQRKSSDGRTGGRTCRKIVADDGRAIAAARHCRAEVIKRDGQRAPFELGKIASAIARAGAATGEFDAAEAAQLADAVGRVLAHRHAGGVPDIETIQDCVEHTLAAAGWFHTARAYIVYRDRHERLRADRKTLVDVARVGRRVPRPEGLARQRQRQPGLLARRPDPQRVGQGRRQLLAVARLRAGGRPRAPRRRPPHPRPRHARRLLRRLVAAHAAARGPQRRAGQGRGAAAEAHVERGRPDRQLPRHAAERVGGRAGVQLVRHLHGAVRPHATRLGYDAGEAVHPGARSTTSTCRRAGARRRRSPT